MSIPTPLFRSGLRVLVPLSLGLLLIGLCALLAGVGLHAHAAPPASLNVTNCRGETGPGRIGTVLAHAPAGARITFRCSGTIPIRNTLTITTTHLTLDGSGQKITLDGGNTTQVLSVSSGVTFSLKGLTIAHGFASSGGGLDNGGGTVTISNSTFSANTASYGGGLFNSGTMTISTSTFSANKASNGGGGLLNAGPFPMTISTSTFSANKATNGGGLDNGGPMTISTSTFSANKAIDGGGLYYSGPFPMTISTSTFSANTAIDGGGALFSNFLPDVAVTISNSTFSANTATQGGGAIYDNAEIQISGSIVAKNSGGDCNGARPADQGYNLDSDGSCFTATTSLHANPLLAALAFNGGPTRTMALLKGSPARKAIPLATLLCPKTDQRGYKRPDNPHACDIGAYEA